MASFYKDWGGIGGCTNFLAYGEFPETEKEPESLYMPRGAIYNKDLSKIVAVDQMKVTEDVTRGWYEPAPPSIHGPARPSRSRRIRLTIPRAMAAATPG